MISQNFVDKENRTIRGEGSEVDVLTGLAGLLLGRGHFRSAGWTCKCGRNTGREKKEEKKEASISSINAHIEAESCDAVPVTGLGRGGLNDYVMSPEKLKRVM